MLETLSTLLLSGHPDIVIDTCKLISLLCGVYKNREIIFFDDQIRSTLANYTGHHSPRIKSAACDALVSLVNDSTVEMAKSKIVMDAFWYVCVMNDASAKKHAANSLRIIGKHAKSVGEAAIDAGILDSLKLLLLSNNHSIQNMAANTFFDLSNVSEEVCNKMVKQGSLSPLISCIRSSDKEAVLLGVSTIINLSNNAKSRKKIGMVGGIPVLLGCLENHDSETKAKVCECLSYLAVDQRNIGAMIRVGASLKGVEWLIKGDNQVCDKALMLLSNLAVVDEEKEKICTQAVLDKVATLLQSGEDSLQIKCVTLLIRLASLKRNRSTIIDSQCISPLFSSFPNNNLLLNKRLYQLFTALLSHHCSAVRENTSYESALGFVLSSQFSSLPSNSESIEFLLAAMDACSDNEVCMKSLYSESMGTALYGLGRMLTSSDNTKYFAKSIYSKLHKYENQTKSQHVAT